MGCSEVPAGSSVVLSVADEPCSCEPRRRGFVWLPLKRPHACKAQPAFVVGVTIISVCAVVLTNLAQCFYCASYVQLGPAYRAGMLCLNNRLHMHATT